MAFPKINVEFRGAHPLESIAYFRITLQDVQLLATAISQCYRCPVYEDGICSGLLTLEQAAEMGKSYGAVVEVNGVDSHSTKTVEEQINGNKCGITAAQLNTHHPVRMNHSE